MDAKTELQSYKKILDKKLAEYFAVRITDAKKISPLAAQAAKNIRDLTMVLAALTILIVSILGFILFLKK